jgi:hypothetical protein
MRGLCNKWGTPSSTAPSVAPRACIFIRNTVQAFSLLELSSPTRTNWESCEEDLKVRLWVVPRVAHLVWDAEMAVDSVEQATLFCHQNCPAKMAFSPRRVPWRSKELTHLKASTRQLFHKAK